MRDIQLVPIFPLLPLFFGGKKEAGKTILISMKSSQFYRTLLHLELLMEISRVSYQLLNDWLSFFFQCQLPE